HPAADGVCRARSGVRRRRGPHARDTAGLACGRLGHRRTAERGTHRRVGAMTPPKPPDVQSVWQMGSAPAAANAAWTLVGQDGGQSIDLGDEVLFVFADTLVAHTAAVTDRWPAMRWPIRRDQGRFLANCCARAGRAGLPAELTRLRYALDDTGWPAEM